MKKLQVWKAEPLSLGLSLHYIYFAYIIFNSSELI